MPSSVCSIDFKPNKQQKIVKSLVTSCVMCFYYRPYVNLKSPSYEGQDNWCPQKSHMIREKGARRNRQKGDTLAEHVTMSKNVYLNTITCG